MKKKKPDRVSETPKRPVGRPRKRQMAEPIPDTPENIARALMMAPPLDEDWLKEDVDVEEN